MAYKCPGYGHQTRAKLPNEVSKSGRGPGLVALLATLSAVTAATRRQLNWFGVEVLGAPSSLGTIQKASQTLDLGFDQAHAAISRAAKVGID